MKINLKNLKKIGTVAMGVALSIAITSCSGAKTSNTIVIGEIGPITGDAAQYGQAAFNGVQLAVDEFGDINGKKVEIKQYDDANDSAQAVNAYNRLVDNDNVTAIIGAVTSTPCVAVSEASQEKQTPIITPTGTKESITTTGPNIFRACFIDPYQGEVMAKFAASTLNAKTAAIVINNGSDYSTGLAESFKATFEANGGTVVASESYAATDVDYKTQLTLIKDAAPDVLFVPDYYTQVALIAKQVKDIGLETTLLGGDGWDGVLDVVDDKTILDGSYTCNGYSPDDTDPNVQEFIAKYKEKFNAEPNGFAATGYDAAVIVLNAIKNCGDDITNENIIAQMNKTDVVGSGGQITFDANRNPIRGAVVIEYKEGKATMVEKVR